MTPQLDSAREIAEQLRSYIDRAVERAGTTVARKPAHRIKFHWPPHPISYSYHVLASDWTGLAQFDAHGEIFDVEVADTPYGVFGRCDSIWLEARGETKEEMLQNLRDMAEPLFRRQIAINRTLEQPGRFTGHIRDLSPLEHLKLLFCEDRDVANEAQSEIETHARNGCYFDGLIAILDDRRHPNRRSAQWCVLDVFESLPNLTIDADDVDQAVRAMKALIWDADDDYARTVYKAGVVLGGHIPDHHGGSTLIACLDAPSKIGRRSAIHGLFHVVEWIPESRDEVVSALKRVSHTDPEPLLRDFAASMAEDIADGALDHRHEPFFPDEP